MSKTKSVKKTENKQPNGRHKLTEAGPGRPKGSKNKFTSLKESFLEAFEKIGGTKALVIWAKKNSRNQGQFYQMLSKMLPTNVNVEGDMKLTYEISDKFMPKTGNEKNGN